MPQNLIERLRYYQGRYLSAEDFQVQQEYHRSMRRRHNVGQHSLGIVAGLEFVEVVDEAGGLQVYVLPGMAIDGFGNEILVLQPHALDPALFEPFRNQGQRFLSVWIRFRDELAGRPLSGYELCAPDDQLGRVRETFELAVEPDPPHHDDIVVAGLPLSLEDTEEPPAVDDVLAHLTLPLDESVPNQELPPDEDQARWLVRLGNVHWSGTALIPDDADPPLLNQDRRYVGVIAEQAMAPQGEFQIRDRRAPDPLPADSTDPLYPGVAAVVQGSLHVERDTTAEQDLHVQGNAGVGVEPGLTRLHVDGGTAAGVGDETGYFLIGDVALTNLVFDDSGVFARDAGAASTLHLQRFGGRLDIHAAQADARVAVTADGRVGVGSDDPQVKLQVDGGEAIALADEESGYLLIGDVEDRNVVFDDRAVMARNNGAPSPLELQADGGDVTFNANVADAQVAVKGSGRIGISTNNPVTWLHINDHRDASLSGHGLLVLGETSGLNLVLDDNEIMARDGGAIAPLALQANGGDLTLHTNVTGDSTKFAVKDSGRVGIGTFDPVAPLQVLSGTDVTMSDSSGYLVIGDVNGDNVAFDSNEIQARANGAAAMLHVQADGGVFRVHHNQPVGEQVSVTDSGSVGIGTQSPLEKLHVIGNVRANSVIEVSDEFLKEDIETISGALDRVSRLRGVRFRWREQARNNLGLTSGPQLGFVAQEVEKEFPEAVAVDADGLHTLAPVSLLPALVEAIKEIEQRVARLEESSSRSTSRKSATKKASRKKSSKDTETA